MWVASEGKMGRRCSRWMVCQVFASCGLGGTRWWSNWTAEEVDMVVMHELAHLKRRHFFVAIASGCRCVRHRVDNRFIVRVEFQFTLHLTGFFRFQVRSSAWR